MVGGVFTIEASIITDAYTILRVPYYKYSIMGPNTLLQLLRPLYNAGYRYLKPRSYALPQRAQDPVN